MKQTGINPRPIQEFHILENFFCFIEQVSPLDPDVSIITPLPAPMPSFDGTDETPDQNRLIRGFPWRWRWDLNPR
ncbi:MAG: hypothetical protein ACTIIT_15035, partial [Brevibacterium linens]